MAAEYSEIPQAALPFPRAEYERRQQKVLAAMVRADLDALLVTAYGHLRYLTGYDGLGGYFAPFPLILMPGRTPTYVIREFDEKAVRAYSCIDEIVCYTQEPDFAKVCADILRRYELHDRRVGLELGSWNLAPTDVSALQAQLPEMKVKDATRLVSAVAAVKSELELEVMRKSMALTDVAVLTFQRSLREGITEIEMASAILEEVGKAGGDLNPNYTLAFGERTRLPHAMPKRNAIKANEPAMIEIGASIHGYVAGLVRGAVLGRHHDTESLYALAVEVLEAAIAIIKPGVTAGEVDAAARKVVERSGRSRAFRHRTGYQTGIHWSERGELSLEPGASDILKAGMTLHMPIILFSESGYTFGCSEQVLVTERGAEVLSSTPRTLYHA